MSEYEDEENTEENEELEQELQEIDEETIGSEMEELDDFELTYNNDIEKEIEDFEPSHETDLVELTEDFKLTNKIDSDQLNNDFIPCLDNIDLETSGEEQHNPYIKSIIKSIENNPLLSPDEKIDALNKKLEVIRGNPNLSQREKQQFERGIEGAISNLEAAAGRILTSGNNTSEQSTSNTENNHNNSKNDFSSQKEGIPDSSEENHIYSKIKEEKNLETNEQETYENLLDDRIQKTFKHYANKTKKNPNYGRNLSEDFINWVSTTEKDSEIIDKVHDIQNYKEISNFIKDKIRNSTISQTEIANKINETGLSVSRKTVGNYALKNIFNSNKLEYNKRFDKSLDSTIKERIINRLNKEVEKFASGVQHDSLYKIAKDFPEVHKTTIDKIAKNEISQDVYKKMWPTTKGTVDPETKQNIKNVIEREVQKGTPRSLRNISEDFPDVSMPTISDLAKEMYPEEYKELWPKIEKIPGAIKNEIINTIQDEAQKENPRTLKEIHKDFQEVGADTIKRLAHQAVPKEIHDKIWSNEIPEDTKENIREIIRNEVKLPKPRSLNSIRKQFGVGMESVLRIAREEIPKEIYEKVWPAREEISSETKSKIINDIKYSKLNINEIGDIHSVSTTSVSNISQNEVFKENIEKHRERFPYNEHLEIGNFTHLNINSVISKSLIETFNEKYYSEPRVYIDGRRPDGLILENNGFIQKRLTNTTNGEYLREKLDLDPNDLDQIKATQFDFTNDIGNENLINKIEKYQSKDTLLIIVGTRWHLYDDIKHLPKNERIKYPQNIRVISHELAANFLGLEDKEKKLYDEIIDHNIDCNLNSLQELYLNELSKINSYNIDDLKQDMIQKDLIKENFDEYFQFEALRNKDKNKKQSNLDYFIKG